ncbi:MAG: hypothetical protein NZO16_04835 [Deltaproteobacteria bacterium]|nr:hypothetical protein [Deltaproteobacteria bacterium]
MGNNNCAFSHRLHYILDRILAHMALIFFQDLYSVGIPKIFVIERCDILVVAPSEEFTATLSAGLQRGVGIRNFEIRVVCKLSEVVKIANILNPRTLICGGYKESINRHSLRTQKIIEVPFDENMQKFKKNYWMLLKKNF